LGDYREVEGYPDWFMRPPKMRQQAKMERVWNLIQKDADSKEFTYTEYMAKLAASLLYKMTAGGEFVSVVEDEILDTFTLEELQERVMKPMGYGQRDETPNA